MDKLHCVMPMAGRGSRFLKTDFDLPKPLIRLYGRPFFFWSTESIRRFIGPVSLDFVVLREHEERYGIKQEILRLYPTARVHVLPEVTEGAVITCLEGAKEIEDDAPVVFNDCDHLFKSRAFNRFTEDGRYEGTDGLLLTFPSGDPKYGFVEKDPAGAVIRTAEKQAVSDEAICGCYWFRNRRVFEESAERYLRECAYAEYFMSGVYNVMIAERLRVRSLPVDFHVPFGTPEEYEAAKGSRLYGELL